MRPGSPKLTFAILIGLSSLGAVSTDIIVPLLPTLVGDLDANPESTELVLSMFMIGVAIGQLFYGPLSDSLGRRPPIIFGCVLYAVAGIGCAQSDSVESLVLWRFLQGLGASSGPALARAVISDLYDRRRAAEVISKTASYMSLLPASSPFVSGLIVAVFGWEWVFVLLSVYGLLIVWFFATKLPETHHPDNRRLLGLGAAVKSYMAVGRSAPYWEYTVAGAASFGAMIAYVGANSHMVIGHFAVREELFGFTFLVVAAGFIAGTSLSSVTVARFGVAKLLISGAVVGVLGSALVLATALLPGGGLLAFLAPIPLVSFGCGMCLPNSQIAGAKLFPRDAGSASALSGTIQVLCGAIGSLLAIGAMPAEDYRPMAATMLGFSVLALASAVLAFRRSATDETAPLRAQTQEPQEKPS